MPRTCTVCSHPDRRAIEQQLVAGGAYRPIASQYGVGYKSVQRHASEHVKQQIAEHKEAREEAQALDVVRQLRAINEAATAILTQARKARDHEIALKAIDRIQRQLELQAKLLGELDERPHVNVLISAEYLSVQAAVLLALAPYPDARVAVAEALGRLDRVEVSNGHAR